MPQLSYFPQISLIGADFQGELNFPDKILIIAEVARMKSTFLTFYFQLSLLSILYSLLLTKVYPDNQI